MTERSDRNGWQANLPPRWLNDATYKSLTVNAWTLHTWTLVWGVGQENDGYVTTRDLPFIASPMLNRAESEDAAAELVREGIWEGTADGYRVAGWELSQVTAAEINEKRSTWRAKNNRRKTTAPKETPKGNTADTPRVKAVHPQSNGTLQVGNEGHEGHEGNAGNANQAPPVRFQSEVHTDTGEVIEPPQASSSWVTAIPGRPGEYSVDPGYCRKHGGRWPCNKTSDECEWIKAA